MRLSTALRKRRRGGDHRGRPKTKYATQRPDQKGVLKSNTRSHVTPDHTFNTRSLADDRPARPPGRPAAAPPQLPHPVKALTTRLYWSLTGVYRINIGTPTPFRLPTERSGTFSTLPTSMRGVFERKEVSLFHTRCPPLKKGGEEPNGGHRGAKTRTTVPGCRGEVLLRRTSWMLMSETGPTPLCTGRLSSKWKAEQTL